MPETPESLNGHKTAILFHGKLLLPEMQKITAALPYTDMIHSIILQNQLRILLKKKSKILSI